jgi:isoleucyl-tRNA synthetase
MEKFNLLESIQLRVLRQKIASYKRWIHVVPISSPKNNKEQTDVIYKERLTRILEIFWLTFHFTELLDRWLERMPEDRKETFRRNQRSILKKIHFLDNQMQENVKRYTFDKHVWSLMHEIYDLFDNITYKYEPFYFVLK